jgi:hypothetical protein
VQLHRELEVSYCRLVTISTDNITETNEFRTGVDAHWPFLSDAGRVVQKGSMPPLSPAPKLNLPEPARPERKIAWKVVQGLPSFSFGCHDGSVDEAWLFSLATGASDLASTPSICSHP